MNYGTIFARHARFISEISAVKNFLILIFYTLLWLPSTSQVIYENKVYDPNFKSVQVFPEGNPIGYPIVALNSGEALEFHFDEMTSDLNNYSYVVNHCNHLWQMSDLDASEYIQGFPSQNITEYDASFNTTIDFVHHRFTFPNDMVVPRYSGNYLITVFAGNDATDDEQWKINYRVVIYESAVSLTGHATASSVIAERYKNQDVNFNIHYENFTFMDPTRDLHITLLQNMDWSTAITNLKPVFIKNTDLVYQFNMGENMFKSGAEYRNFEMKSIQYASIETEKISQESDGYHAWLRPDLPTGGKSYSTQPDINGKFLIRNDLADDSHLEADYVWVHFLLEMPEMEESDMYVEGWFNQFEKTKLLCTYDQELKGYTCKSLMKQGYYNYRYYSQDKFYSLHDVSRTEGNYSQTENDYVLIAYMYDRSQDCDRVIALQIENSVR